MSTLGVCEWGCGWGVGTGCWMSLRYLLQSFPVTLHHLTETSAVEVEERGTKEWFACRKIKQSKTSGRKQGFVAHIEVSERGRENERKTGRAEKLRHGLGTCWAARLREGHLICGTLANNSPLHPPSLSPVPLLPISLAKLPHLSH